MAKMLLSVGLIPQKNLNVIGVLYDKKIAMMEGSPEDNLERERCQICGELWVFALYTVGIMLRQLFQADPSSTDFHYKCMIKREIK